MPQASSSSVIESYRNGESAALTSTTVPSASYPSSDGSGSNTRTANSSFRRVSASSNAPTITPTSSAAGRSARSCGGSRRVKATANARRASARSGGTEASRSSSTEAGRAPAVTSSVVLTLHMVPVPEHAPDLRLQERVGPAEA
jgi:hypothetical protein